MSTAVEFVTLVDAYGAPIGTSEKHMAHRLGLRHAAFSVFLVDSAGRLLMQRRHPLKYHSGGLWANSCCGHPRPGERISTAASRRVHEELGVRVPLQFGFCTAYRGELGNGMIENEMVTIFFGRVTAAVSPDPAEISQVRMMDLPKVADDVQNYPTHYAYWLRHYFSNHRGEIAAQCARIMSDGVSNPGFTSEHKTLRISVDQRQA